MTVTQQFAGQSYLIPDDEEVGWEALTQYLIALGTFAATTQSMLFNVRNVTDSPATLQQTDTVLCCNFAGSGVVNLPVGVTKTFYWIVDVSGNAQSNPITVTPSGGQQINGASTYEVNSNNGAVLLQFNGTSWVVLAIVSDVFKTVQKIENNATNKSFVTAAIIAVDPGVSANNEQACSASFVGSETIIVTISLSSGESMTLQTSFAKAEISAISDGSNIFLTSDAGVGVFVSKSAASSVLTFKNRMGAPKVIEIKSLTTNIVNPTVWA